MNVSLELISLPVLSLLVLSLTRQLFCFRLLQFDVKN